MGYSGAKFDPEQVDLFFESSAGKLQIIANGTATDYSEEKATEILSQEKVTAIADLKAGDAEATAWGCDLTHGYIDINDGLQKLTYREIIVSLKTLKK